MKHLLLTALFSFYFSTAQSDYFNHFINNNVEQVSISTTILDTGKILMLSDYDCRGKKILKIGKITEPRIVSYQKGEMLKEQDYIHNGGILSLISKKKIVRLTMAINMQ
ncbi:MAG: hypothetical protein ACNS60_10610 [Candidatus Cyclobacteriaceae bacterium M2_1C_046]